MTYVVTENCINCKFQDCVAVCPVDCFYEGENFLVIHPEECIDCGVCEPECPADAIKADTEPDLDEWLAINEKYAQLWPNITVVGAVPSDANEWNGKPDKARLLITGEEPAEPHAQKPVYEPGSVPQDATAPKFETDGAKISLPDSQADEELVELPARPPVQADGFEIDGLRVKSDDPD